MTPETTPIEVVVVGGGVAGLCAAIGLCRGKHRVTLLEDGDDWEQTELSGGCRIPSNVAKTFYKWGMEERIKALGRTMEKAYFLGFETGEVHAGFDPEPEVFAQTGAEIVCMHYVDLRKLLRDEALSAGTTVKSNARVTAYHPHHERPSVTLDSGETFQCDVVVAADGMSGLSRQLFLGDKDETKYLKKMMYNAVIDNSALDAELQSFVRNHQLSCWHDGDRGATGFPIGRDVYSLHVFSQGAENVVTAKEYVEIDQLVRSLDGCEPRLLQLAQQAKTVISIAVTDRPHLTDWVHPDGRLLVIGEAAHPAPPGSFYALTMAAGDGIVLGRLFEHLHRKDQIPRYLAGVQEVRKERLTEIMKIASRNPFALSFPEAQVKSISEENKFAYMQEVFMGIYGRDFSDEADDWWTQWGILQERAARTISYTIEVNKEKRSGSPHSD